MANRAVTLPMPAVHTKLTRQQITGFWGAWTGWTLDGMDSVIYALVLSPALTELLPKSGYKATPANVGFAGSTLFALFLVGWGLSLIWGPIADKFGRSRVLAYVIGGLFSAVGGLGLTMTTGIGSPRAGVLYTLSGLAAVVIGGVSLVGGRGGVVGPVIAAFVLTLIPSDLIFLNIDPNFGQVIQGTLIVLVVMLGGLATLLRRRP